MSNELQHRYEHALAIRQNADLIHSASDCQVALETMAQRIQNDLGHAYPLVLAVMGGAVVFSGKLLALLDFPLDFDYIHITRYGDKLKGGEFEWLRQPKNVGGRDVLVLDDILDEGQTMFAIQNEILARGAKSCRTAVFANKLLNQNKPIQADYVGVDVPNRYVFGYGMDAQGMWRNLDAIYALKEH